MKEDTDWWWIDYMEGELDPTTFPDVEFLLEKSSVDRKNFESWQMLKSWVKDVDESSAIERAWSEVELTRLKGDILSQVASSKSQSTCKSSEVSLRVF